MAKKQNLIRQVNYVVYHPATGEIVRSGTCQDIDMAAQADDLPGHITLEVDRTTTDEHWKIRVGQGKPTPVLKS